MGQRDVRGDAAKGPQGRQDPKSRHTLGTRDSQHGKALTMHELNDGNEWRNPKTRRREAQAVFKSQREKCPQDPPPEEAAVTLPRGLTSSNDKKHHPIGGQDARDAKAEASRVVEESTSPKGLEKTQRKTREAERLIGVTFIMRSKES